MLVEIRPQYLLKPDGRQVGVRLLLADDSSCSMFLEVKVKFTFMGEKKKTFVLFPVL